MKNENLRLLERKEEYKNCHPGRLLAGVSRLYGCVIKKEKTSLFNERQKREIPDQVRDDNFVVRDDILFCIDKGFTLIELLVVVLIIGILAAVALPQYQIAVEKARATEAVVNLRLVVNALELYHLENGVYPASLQDLSIDLPNKYRYSYLPTTYVGINNFWTAGKGRQYMIAHLLDHRSEWKHKKLSGVCSLISGDPGTSSLATTLCKQMCGVSELKTYWGSEQKGCDFDDFSRKS